MREPRERAAVNAHAPAADWAVLAASDEDVVPMVLPRRWRGSSVYRLVREPSAVLGLAFLVAVAASVLFAPLIARFDPRAINVEALNQLPSARHPFGTDFFGRDLLARTLYGGRLSLIVGFGVVAIEAFGGVFLGLLSGYAGKIVDGLIMRVMEVLLAVPGILLALGTIAVLGPGLESLIIALGIGGIPGYARLMRGMALKVREQEYVLASRATGCSRWRTLWRHILPNAMDPAIVMATTSFGAAILAASALSYIGVGVQPPDADWGSLLKNGYDHMFEAWSEIVLPGVVVSLTVLGSTLLGDGLTNARSPRR